MQDKKVNILEASDLAIGYSNRKSKQVVTSDLNFGLQAGELVALVGPNGIGKSTLLRTLSGVQQPLNGSVTINGVPLSDNTPLMLATQLSLVLTQAPASVNLNVTELVGLGRQPYTGQFGRMSSTDHDIVKKALVQTESLELSERRCYELSDGQLQRVIIARALAQDTELIIMDEPTTHLDLYHRAYILKLLKQLTAGNKKTVLFSTHEIDLAIQVSDKMLVMDQNACYFGEPEKLIADGRFNELFPKDSVHFDQNSGRFTLEN